MEGGRRGVKEEDDRRIPSDADGGMKAPAE